MTIKKRPQVYDQGSSGSRKAATLKAKPYIYIILIYTYFQPCINICIYALYIYKCICKKYSQLSCVYIIIHILICIWIFILYIYTNIYVYTRIYIHIDTYTHIHTYIHACMHTCIHIYILTQVRSIYSYLYLSIHSSFVFIYVFLRTIEPAARQFGIPV